MFRMNMKNIQEYYVKCCESHITLLWIWIMLCEGSMHIVIFFCKRPRDTKRLDNSWLSSAILEALQSCTAILVREVILDSDTNIYWHGFCRILTPTYPCTRICDRYLHNTYPRVWSPKPDHYPRTYPCYTYIPVQHTQVTLIWQSNTTQRYCIYCHQFYMSYSILIVNHPCSVTNTRCKPNTICHSLLKRSVHYRFTILQLLSLTKWFFIQMSTIHDNVSLHQ